MNAELRSAASVLRPQSVAIVGASERSGGGWSKILFDNLTGGGFPGRVYLVNPKAETLWGRRCFPDFAAIPERVDTALVVVGAAAVPAMLANGQEHGLRSAILYASGFGEQHDAEGAERAGRLKQLCAGPGGLRIAGPNGMGVLGIRERALFYPSRRVRDLPAGNVAVAFTSGGSLQFWLRQAAARGLGFSYAVTLGNEIDLDISDYINFFLDDEHTHVICALVEGIRRPAAFLRVAERALQLRKPIVLVKVGSTPAGKAAALSHTGALAGDDAVFDAVCRRYGITRCESLDGLLETALAFAPGRFPTGQGVGMVCHSGGIKGLFLDAASQQGLRFPPLAGNPASLIRAAEPAAVIDNPLDAGATLAEASDRFKAVCLAVAGDPSVDILALQGRVDTDTPGAHPAAMYAELQRVAGKPVIAFERIAHNVVATSRDFQAAAGIPFLQGIPHAAHALRALVEYGLRLRMPPPPPAPVFSERPATGAQRMPSEGELRVTLETHGVRFPREEIASDETTAVAAAERIGFPVAVKLAAADGIHKTELGGVHLNVSDAPAVRRAVQAIEQAVSRLPVVRRRAFLIQEMVTGLEFLVGAREDPQFGPIVVVGLGGVYAEALNDTAIRPLPIDRDEATRMLAEVHGSVLLGPFRGRPAADTGALLEVVLGVATSFLAHRDAFTDIEINPVIVRAGGLGARAVDLRTIAHDRRD